MADGACSICGGPVRSISKYGICTRNEACRREADRQRGLVSYKNNRLRYILTAARRRARASGVPFDLVVEDLPEIPESCPILGLKLQVRDAGPHPDSPSLDRRDPALGYVPSNVWWISHQANTMKSSADAEMLYRFAWWVLSQEPEHLPTFHDDIAACKETNC